MNLIESVAGAGSKNEELKLHGECLRGTIAQSLEAGGTHFDESDLQLLKFHGSYQQDNRDERGANRVAGKEKSYQFMIRSRIPGGVLTARQYLVEDELAQRYGNGTLRFTTRQGIQLHGVLKGNLRPTIGAINRALLSTFAACGDVNRNVMACPAPMPGRARAILNDLAHRLAVHLAPRSRAYHEIWIDGEKTGTVVASDSEPMYGATYLPRKFKIGIALEDDNCIDVYTQDLGFVAHTAGGELDGLTVLVGGGLGSTHGKSETYPRLATPLCHIAMEDVLEVAEAIVTIHRDYGDRTDRKHARMKYVVEERGIDWFRAELEQRLGRTLADPRTLQFGDVDDHLGWHRQADGRWFLGLHVRSGRVGDTARHRLRTALREVVTRFQTGVRITPQQNVLLTGIADESRRELEVLLQVHRVETRPERLSIARRALACPALPTCGLAVAEAERVLPGLLDDFASCMTQLGLQEQPPSIRVTGCPNGCARPRMGDIGIVGRSLGLYDLFVGGDAPNTRFNALYAKAVRLDQIVPTLRPLLVLWKHERAANESFGDFCHRLGTPALQERARLDDLATA